MKRHQHFLAATLVVAVPLGSGASRATERMVGVAPSGEEVILLKQFHVPAGATIVGAEFTTNDPNTTFPEVSLVRDLSLATGAGAVMGRRRMPRKRAPALSVYSGPHLCGLFGVRTTSLAFGSRSVRERKASGWGQPSGLMTSRSRTGLTLLVAKRTRCNPFAWISTSGCSWVESGRVAGSAHRVRTHLRRARSIDSSWVLGHRSASMTQEESPSESSELPW